MAEMNPVSAEARGKAREFIRRANVEDDLRFALLTGFWRDIQRRKDHRPGRRIRHDILKDIIGRWEAGPRQYRLRFEVEWKGKNLSAIEIAASGNGTLSAPRIGRPHNGLSEAGDTLENAQGQAWPQATGKAGAQRA